MSVQLDGMPSTSDPYCYELIFPDSLDAKTAGFHLNPSNTLFGDIVTSASGQPAAGLEEACCRATTPTGLAPSLIPMAGS